MNSFLFVPISLLISERFFDAVQHFINALTWLESKYWAYFYDYIG